MVCRIIRFLSFAVAAALLVSVSEMGQEAQAGALTATVNDSDGNPVSDAVVFVISPMPSNAGETSTMVQRNQMFAPHVLAVSTGTTVEFPNEDAFRHHVYSFSPAKNFELKLYGGDEVQRVVFDTPGEVALGCNIHDDMLGYIYVVDSTLFGTTGENGTVTIEGLDDATVYEAQVWHPLLRGPTRRTGQSVSVGNPAIFEIGLERDRREQSGSDFEDGVY
jgi:plastocyanin